MSSTFWTRRRVTTALTGVVAFPLAASATVRSRPGWRAPEDRWLELFNLHTNETLSLVFARRGELIPAALGKLEYFLRDFRVHETHVMDPGLYVQLADLAHAAHCEPRFKVISGYRSPATNRMLLETGHHVSVHSLHMQGRAIDIRLDRCTCARLKDLALLAGRGGVGYYPREDFVHIDTGRVRHWQG